MSNWQLHTPVAFTIFNQVDTTDKVFEAIRQAKPPKVKNGLTIISQVNLF